MNEGAFRFDTERAKAACSDILKALNEPANAERISAARQAAGSDMIRVMQMIFPIVTQVQLEVIQNYGFSGDGEGAAQFLQLLRSLEKEDVSGQVSALSDQVRAFFLPAMTPPIHSNSCSPSSNVPTSSSS